MIFSALLSLGKTEHLASIWSVNFLISLNDRNNLLVLNNSVLFSLCCHLQLFHSKWLFFFSFWQEYFSTSRLFTKCPALLPHSTQHDGLMSHTWVCTVEQSFLLLQIIVPETFNFHLTQPHIFCVSHDSLGCSGSRAPFNITSLSKSLTFCLAVSLMSKTGFTINPSWQMKIMHGIRFFF